MTDGQIIIGYDASPAARAALAWGLDEGLRWRLPVRLIHVLGDDQSADVNARRGAEIELRRLAADLEDWGTLGIAVTASVRKGAVAHVLCEQSRRAAMLVVGDRSHGGQPGLRIGSTSLTVATYAHCPAVVVRSGVAVPSSRPVAVGTDGSPHGGVALQYAFAEAAARGADLLVVRALLPGEDGEATVQERLDKEVLPLRERYPNVDVTTRVTPVTAVHALMLASHDAQLVVVGSRGCGGFAELVLGSVSQQLLQYSLCPVLVVRGGCRPPWSAPMPPTPLGTLQHELAPGS
jgi:nucleotide-binding universal stress UspA family protein